MGRRLDGRIHGDRGRRIRGDLGHRHTSGTVHPPAGNEIQTSTDPIWSQVETIITGARAPFRLVQTATDIIQTAVTGAWSVIKAASENDFGIPEIISGSGTMLIDLQTRVLRIKRFSRALPVTPCRLGRTLSTASSRASQNAGSALTNKLRDLAKGARWTQQRASSASTRPSTVFADVIGNRSPPVLGLASSRGMPAVNEAWSRASARWSTRSARWSTRDEVTRSVSAYEGPGGSG